MVGLGSAFIGGVLGLAIGGVAALFGGLLDKILMRLADVILSFPILLLRDRPAGGDPGRRG